MTINRTKKHYLEEMKIAMDRWKLGYEGFVCQYMVSGPKVSDYESDIIDKDQFKLEERLRKQIARNLIMKDDAGIDIGSGKALAGEKSYIGSGKALVGEKSDICCEWEIAATLGNGFIDKSAFYSTLKKIELEVSTVLVASESTRTTIRLWSYMAAALFVNGNYEGGTDTPVYKPINYKDVEIELNKGENEVLIKCLNLGVRDTRNIVGVQVLDKREKICVTLPDKRIREKVYENLNELGNLKYEDGKLYLGLKEYTISFPKWKSDYEDGSENESVKGTGEFVIPDGKESVRVSCENLVGGASYTIGRTIELSDRIGSFVEKQKEKADKQRYLKTIAEVKSANRGEFGFSIMNILARKALGIDDPLDRKRFFDDLDLVEKRVDCADFLLCGIIRYIKNYEVDEELASRIREVLLNFRYLMNMEGSDGMCFWSENHSLMFYSCMMFAGNMYRDDVFTRSGMTGKELSLYGERKVLEWLKDVEEYGFEEFLSATYTNVTFGALLNLVDFADESISKRASKLCDRMLEEIAMHSFKGTMIAPMGRVYRGVIYPFREGVQSLVHMINNDAPSISGEGWLSYVATSKYVFDERLKELMEKPLDTSYSTGNALINIKKTEDYCLTSVQSPRSDGYKRWKNEKGDFPLDSHAWLKAANESFHGTTFFEPGTYGYQQHMWYAALSAEAVVFINHPGCMAEGSGMRPGYWHGNGVMPALRQQGNVLGGIYKIPDEHPVGFVHIYLPEKRFDEVCEFEDIRSVIGALPFGTENAAVKSNGEGNSSWLFLRKAEGYLAIWCSEKPYKYSDMIFDSELRIASRNSAYVVICGSKAEDGSFEDFRNKAVSFAPYYDKNCGKLFVSGTEYMKYVKGTDKTQYVI
ncbi:hypothetical protein [Butyrivibrio proteoclasticus]|uniref:hypothetical protein n=1 Tax=Butyrivibrio proteoclasticus TaxID=43305 RepID=UPI001A9A4CA9|nr:hypothetical protein [Butyrivibrio proteoclasticus]